MLKDINQRIYKKCSTAKSADEIYCNVGDVIENLLLFENFILSSIRLKELPELIRVFGFDGLTYLLQSGVLKIHCEALSIGETGRTAILEQRKKKGILPLESYAFSAVQMADEKKYIHDCFKVLNNVILINEKQKRKLKEKVSNSFVKYPDNIGKLLLHQLRQDLLNDPLGLKLSLLKVIQQKKGVAVSLDEVKLNVIHICDDDYKIESNLKNILNIDIAESHDLIKTAIFGIGNRNRSILEMKHFNALTGFRDDEVSIFEAKLEFLSKYFNPETPVKSLRKVVHISNLPDLSRAATEGKIDIDKFFKICQSNEIKEFRSWLWSIHEANDAELKEYISNFNQKIGKLIRSSTGKSLRFLSGVGLGLIPDFGPSISAAFSAFDLFLLEKILPAKGALVFLDKDLPTIFKEQ